MCGWLVCTISGYKWVLIFVVTFNTIGFLQIGTCVIGKDVNILLRHVIQN